MTNSTQDIRDFISSFTAQESENITSNNYNNVTSKLLNVSCAYSADSEISSSNETTSPSLAEPRPSIVCIGVSLNQPKKKSPDRRVINVSVTWDNGTNKQFSCNLAHYNRRRELKGTLPDPALAQWEGYDDALMTMENMGEFKQDAFIGKLRNSSKYVHGVPQKSPIVPKTAALQWVDAEGIHVLLWLNNEQFQVDLFAENLNSTQAQFYVASGYYRNQQDIMCEEIF